MSPARSLVIPAGQPVPDLPKSELPEITHPFTKESLHSDISLSVYNGPSEMVNRKPRPATS